MVFLESQPSRSGVNGEGVRRVWQFVSAARGEKEKASPSTATRDVLGKVVVDLPESLLTESMVTKPGFVGVLDSPLLMEYIRSANGSSDVHRRGHRKGPLLLPPSSTLGAGL